MAKLATHFVPCQKTRFGPKRVAVDMERNEELDFLEISDEFWKFFDKFWRFFEKF